MTYNTNPQMTTNDTNAKFIRILFVFVSLGFFAGLAMTADALSKKDIVFPVSELGSCKNETDCRKFCDKPQNAEACLNFAEKYSIFSAGDIQKSRKALKAAESGPGGCSGQAECESYCDDIKNIDECLDFAEKNNMIPPEELAEGRKVQAALAKGATLPGGCKNKSECDNYCNDSNNIEECVTFAEAAGFIPPDELAEAKKMISAMKKGAKPPPCRGKKECDAYCGEPANFEQCLTFAEAAGLLPPEELEGARRALSAIKKGVRPPACRGDKECDIYCGEPEHVEECINFAEAAGFMSAKDAEMARKTGGKGPGGCRGQKECDTFCGNPDNQETCFMFGKEHGLIPEEDLMRMEEGMQQMQELFEDAPPEVQDCLVQSIGQNVIDKIRAGRPVISESIGNKVRTCFESVMTGPGGCKTQEECEAYCQENPEDCSGQGPGPEEGGEEMMQQQEEEFNSPQEMHEQEGREGETQQPMDGSEFIQQQEFQNSGEQPAEQIEFQNPPVEITPSPENQSPTSGLGANLLFLVNRFFNGL